MAKSKMFKLELNSAGVLALLKDPGVAADLSRRGESMRASLPTGDGEEWVANSFIGRDRAQTVVKTANSKARRTAAEDNALIKALSAGR